MSLGLGGNPEVYYRSSVFIPFLDCMIQGLDDCFSRVHEEIALASKLVPAVLLKTARCTEAELKFFGKVLPDMPSVRSCPSEYEVWWTRWQKEKDEWIKLSGFTSALAISIQISIFFSR